MVARPWRSLTRGGLIAGEELGGRLLNGLRPRLMDPAGMTLDAQRPIVLIAGYGAKPSSLQPLVASLNRAGAQHVHVFDPINYALGDINENAAKFARDLRALGQPADVIGWSEGGLIATAAAKFHGVGDLMRRGITVGTPHGGSAGIGPLGKLAAMPQAIDGAMRAVGAPTHLGPATDGALRELYGEATLQMRPGSSFLQALHGTYQLGEGTPGPTRWLAIASEHDGIVPFASAHLPAAPNVENYELHGPWRKTNHMRIITGNDESFQAMLRHLTN
jgi:pimeloyl-ACP methyl ester carboxylesterase